MNGSTVADIAKDKLDLAGSKIETVYSKVSEVYAVYRTPERVMVQFADNDALGSEQRLALAPLNPIRGEINGLIDGWRGTPRFNAAKKQFRARLFDRRTADALTVALQGKPEHAEELLKAVKADIIEERTSIGRTEYLIVAAASAFAVFLVFGWIVPGAATPPEGGASFGSFVAQNNLWLATGVGCLGALFSIALSIRSRDIRTDLQRRDNVVDAILRIMIGAVSAVILFSLFKSQLVTLGLNGTNIELGGSADKATHAAIIIAFLAGFSERLVGDFLSTAVLAGIGSTGAAAAKAEAAAKAAGKSEASEQNPRGKPELEAAPEARAADNDEGDTHVHDDDGSDNCVCDIEVQADEMTDDTELPEASGGIEKAA